ncbi:hypothetical protein cyc_04184 [Cyclospora cayetanensis]|uniref:Uncharacterized protein n=1 Tax=Cyclospora cayetanensis TaxID=88456 RepID=A0A1D3CRW6_9EIME|nr:hypothetical protein cyc_04184 [Cyclospora cayetanensis]
MPENHRQRRASGRNTTATSGGQMHAGVGAATGQQQAAGGTFAASPTSAAPLASTSRSNAVKDPNAMHTTLSICASESTATGAAAVARTAAPGALGINAATGSTVLGAQKELPSAVGATSSSSSSSTGRWRGRGRGGGPPRRKRLQQEEQSVGPEVQQPAATSTATAKVPPATEAAPVSKLRPEQTPSQQQKQQVQGQQKEASQDHACNIQPIAGSSPLLVARTTAAIAPKAAVPFPLSDTQTRLRVESDSAPPDAVLLGKPGFPPSTAGRERHEQQQQHPRKEPRLRNTEEKNIQSATNANAHSSTLPHGSQATDTAAKGAPEGARTVGEATTSPASESRAHSSPDNSLQHQRQPQMDDVWNRGNVQGSTLPSPRARSLTTGGSSSSKLLLQQCFDSDLSKSARMDISDLSLYPPEEEQMYRDSLEWEDSLSAPPVAVPPRRQGPQAPLVPHSAFGGDALGLCKALETAHAMRSIRDWIATLRDAAAANTSRTLTARAAVGVVAGAAVAEEPRALNLKPGTHNGRAIPQHLREQQQHLRDTRLQMFRDEQQSLFTPHPPGFGALHQQRPQLQHQIDLPEQPQASEKSNAGKRKKKLRRKSQQLQLQTQPPAHEQQQQTPQESAGARHVPPTTQQQLQMQLQQGWKDQQQHVQQHTLHQQRRNADWNSHLLLAFARHLAGRSSYTQKGGLLPGVSLDPSGGSHGAYERRNSSAPATAAAAVAGALQSPDSPQHKPWSTQHDQSHWQQNQQQTRPLENHSWLSALQRHDEDRARQAAGAAAVLADVGAAAASAAEDLRHSTVAFEEGGMMLQDSPTAIVQLDPQQTRQQERGEVPHDSDTDTWYNCDRLTDHDIFCEGVQYQQEEQRQPPYSPERVEWRRVDSWCGGSGSSHRSSSEGSLATFHSSCNSFHSSSEVHMDSGWCRWVDRQWSLWTDAAPLLRSLCSYSTYFVSDRYLILDLPFPVAARGAMLRCAESIGSLLRTDSNRSSTSTEMGDASLAQTGRFAAAGRNMYPEQPEQESHRAQEYYAAEDPEVEFMLQQEHHQQQQHLLMMRPQYPLQQHEQAWGQAEAPWGSQELLWRHLPVQQQQLLLHQEMQEQVVPPDANLSVVCLDLQLCSIVSVSCTSTQPFPMQRFPGEEDCAFQAMPNPAHWTARGAESDVRDPAVVEAVSAQLIYEWKSYSRKYRQVLRQLLQQQQQQQQRSNLQVQQQRTEVQQNAQNVLLADLLLSAVTEPSLKIHLSQLRSAWVLGFPFMSRRAWKSFLRQKQRQRPSVTATSAVPEAKPVALPASGKGEDANIQMGLCEIEGPPKRRSSEAAAAGCSVAAACKAALIFLAWSLKPLLGRPSCGPSESLVQGPLPLYREGARLAEAARVQAAYQQAAAASVSPAAAETAEPPREATMAGSQGSVNPCEASDRSHLIRGASQAPSSSLNSPSGALEEVSWIRDFCNKATNYWACTPPCSEHQLNAEHQQLRETKTEGAPPSSDKQQGCAAPDWQQLYAPTGADMLWTPLPGRPRCPSCGGSWGGLALSSDATVALLDKDTAALLAHVASSLSPAVLSSAAVLPLIRLLGHVRDLWIQDITRAGAFRGGGPSPGAPSQGPPWDPPVNVTAAGITSGSLRIPRDSLGPLRCMLRPLVSRRARQLMAALVQTDRYIGAARNP